MFPVAVPVPGDVVVTVMKPGPATLEKLKGSPFGSCAEIDRSRASPALRFMVAIGVKTGGQFPLGTVMTKLLVSLEPVELAVTLAEYVPAGGAGTTDRWMVPVCVVPI